MTAGLRRGDWLRALRRNNRPRALWRDDVSFGVAVVPGAPAFALWDALHAMPDAVGAVTDAGEPPGAVPWCGVVAHPGLLMVPGAAVWLADFERCIAWALWEQHHAQRH